MGLDMYLIKKTYIGAEYEHRKITGTIDLKKDGVPIKINLKKVSEIEESVGYWRKANQIHQWFVTSIQAGKDDCQEYEVSKEHVLALLAICKEVRDSSKLVDGAIKNGDRLENGVWIPIIEDGKEIQDSRKAEKLLPTTSEFFFGGTDYDEYYYQDIENTIIILEEILASEPADQDYFENSYYYRSSW